MTKPSTDNSTTSSVLSLTQAREEKERREFAEMLRKHSGYFEPSPPYLVERSQVVSLKTNEPTSSDK